MDSHGTAVIFHFANYDDVELFLIYLASISNSTILESCLFIFVFYCHFRRTIYGFNDAFVEPSPFKLRCFLKLKNLNMN